MAKKSGKQTGKHKATTGKSKSVSAARPAVSRGSGHELVPVICGDCYAEFMFDSASDADIDCPVCGHAARRPDDATVHRAADLRRKEKLSFIMAFTAAMLGFLGVGALTFLGADPANAKEAAMLWGPVGAAVLGGLGGIILSVPYEGNRWEAYF